MMVMALTMQAQTIEFSNFEKGSNPCKWEADGVIMTAKDAEGKMMADEGNRKFEDGQRFATRLKTGGKSNKSSAITVKVPAKGKLTVYASSGSSSEARSLSILLGLKPLATATIDNQNKAPIAADVEKGEYILLYPDGAVNIYGVKFVAE